MSNFFAKLITETIDAVSIPVAIVKDAFTLGNINNEGDGCYTKQEIERLREKAEEKRK